VPNPFADPSGASAGAVPRLGDPANPYAKAAPADQPAYQWKSVAAGDLVHSRVDLGELFHRSWDLFTRQLGTGVLFGLICLLVAIAVQFVSFPLSMAQQAVGRDIGLTLGIFAAQQVWGLIVQTFFISVTANFGVLLARGNPSPLGQSFAIGHCYLKVLGLVFMLQVLSTIITVLCMIPGLALFFVPDDVVQILGLILMAGGFVVALAITMLICLIFFLAVYFIVDRRMGVIESLIASKQFMQGNKLIALPVLLVTTLGAPLLVCCTCGIGMLFVVPYAAALNSTLYLMATGQPIASGLPTGRNSPYDYKPIVGPNEPTKWSASDR
jgi:hypothetical protein